MWTYARRSSAASMHNIALVLTEGERCRRPRRGWLVQPSPEQIGLFSVLEWVGLAVVSIIGILWLVTVARRPLRGGPARSRARAPRLSAGVGFVVPDPVDGDAEFRTAGGGAGDLQAGGRVCRHHARAGGSAQHPPVETDRVRVRVHHVEQCRAGGAAADRPYVQRDELGRAEWRTRGAVAGRGADRVAGPHLEHVRHPRRQAAERVRPRRRPGGGGGDLGPVPEYPDFVPGDEGAAVVGRRLPADRGGVPAGEH